MVAIIKQNFRLQNARDFLENLKSHPRTLDGLSAPLEESASLTAVAEDGGIVANATYTWSWPISAVVTDTQNSSQLKKDAVYGLREKIGSHLYDRNCYLFVGKTTPWTAEDWPGNTDAFNSLLDPSQELSPKPALDTPNEERRVWDEMIGLKKINGLSASLVVPRSDWDGTGKTVYKIYDDRDPNLYAEPSEQDISRLIAGRAGLRLGAFYVLNSEYDLFMCIETGINPEGLSNTSTEEPRRTQTPGSLIDYSDIDGYVWKYITSIKQTDVTKFTTDHWLPIRTLTEQETRQSENDELAGGLSIPQAIVQSTSLPGAVVSFVVDNGPAQASAMSYTTTHNGTLTGPVVTNSVSTGTLALIVGGPALSNINNIYSNMHLYITSTGRGQGERYTIASYNSTSRIISLAAGETWSDNIKNPSLSQQSISITYDILPIVTVSSNGTIPVKLKPVVSNGMISRILVVDPGLNATYVAVTVSPTSGLLNTTTVIPAKIRPVISPRRGLGADPEKDLGAFFVMINAKLSHNEQSGDFPMSNDYRQLGIIRDVKKTNGNIATADTLNACNGLTVSAVSDGLFVADEIVSQTYSVSGLTKVAKARIVEFKTHPTIAGSYFISYIQTLETGYNAFVATVSDLTKLYSNRTGSVNSSCGIVAIEPSEIKKFEGEILYLENRRAVLRSPEQTEDIKAIIEF